MKRDLDLIRELLLRLEATNLQISEPMPQFVMPQTLTEPGEDLDNITYHLHLLCDARFVEPYLLAGNRFIGVTRLTWAGCDFLDSVRDEKIWRRTKEGAAKAGGFTVELLVDLAKGLLKKQVEEHTGIKL